MNTVPDLSPGKSTYTLPVTFHFPLSATNIEPAGGEGGGSGKRKVIDDVQRKMYTLVYPDPDFIHTF